MLRLATNNLARITAAAWAIAHTLSSLANAAQPAAQPAPTPSGAPMLAALPAPNATLAASSVRAVTFNLYNHPWERAERTENAIELLKIARPDIIALQEVARGLFLPGDPSEKIAEALGYNRKLYWHEENWGLFRTGVAVLSRYPIVSSEYHDFVDHGFWNFKGYMLAKIALPGGKILQLVNLHMASTTDAKLRQAEWTELEGFVRTLRAQGPVLITGDFNTLPTDSALLNFVKSSSARSLYDGWKNISELRTWTPDYRDNCANGADPASELVDYFFALSGTAPGASTMTLRGGRILVPGRPPHPSDHCPVEAEIALD